MKNKGFTLVELIAVVAILGLIALFGVPSLRYVINDNNSSACKYYERAMKEAAKAYISKEGKDIIENPSLGGSGNFPSNYNITQATLINGRYITAYNDNNTNIENGKVTVTYNSSTKTYTYTTHVTCKKTNGDTLYTS